MFVLSKTAAWSALVVVVLAPALGGCQPPWAWGFLLALVSLCAAASCLANAGLPEPERTDKDLFRRPLRWVVLAGMALLLWASLLCLYDHLADPTAGRFPRLASRGLIHLWAAAAAFVTGLSWGATPWHFRRALRLVFIAGVVYAALNTLQWLGLGPLQILGWSVSPKRPSGSYTNANRYAVMLAMCWACGVGLVCAALFTPRPRRARPRWRGLTRAAGLAGALLLALGLAVTLSRLTILALGLSLGCAGVVWVLKAAQAPGGYPARRWGARFTQPAKGRPKLALLLAALVAPVVVCVAAAMTMAGNPLGQRFKFVTQTHSPAQDWRLGIIPIGWQLMTERPLSGWGLDSFETVFCPRQPLDIGKRVTQLYSDWLQAGVELGVPALALLLAATAALAALAWRALRWNRRPARFLSLMGVSVGLAVVLMASLMDFPLREPANAMLFFFLVGALCAASQREVLRTAKASPATRLNRALPALLRLPLACVFLAVALASARAGCAAAASPWLGWTAPPPAQAAHLQGYRRALRIAPQDPDLLYPYGLALAAKLQASPPRDQAQLRAELATVLEDMDQVNPQDHRRPLLEAQAYACLGEYERAAQAWDRTLAIAPAYRSLRMQAVLLRLDYVLPATPTVSAERFRELSLLFRDLRVLLRLEPEREEWFVSHMTQLGLSPFEIVDLWPREDPAAVMRRARFWAGQRHWGAVGWELSRLPGSEAGTPWAQALRGAVDFAEGNLEQGLKQWEAALAHPACATDPGLERWLAEEVDRIPSSAALLLAERQAQTAAQLPAIALALGWRLVRDDRLEAADRIMALAVHRRPEAGLYRCWAEVAVRQGDYVAALARARMAWDISPRASRWRKWFEGFQERCRRNSLRPRAKKP
jgi:O-antigen ligase